MNAPGNERFINDCKLETNREAATARKLRIIPAASVVFPKRGGAIATKYGRLRRSAPDAPAVRRVPVQGVVVRPGSGALNEIEAKPVVKELERLCIQQGYRGTVGVVTPFRAQANRIRNLVNAHPHASLLLNKLELLIDTVHKFQGDERDVLVFSLVVSKGIAFRAFMLASFPMVRSSAGHRRDVPAQ